MCDAVTAMSSETSPVHARTAASLAAHLLPRVPELADALMRTIHEQNPDYRTMDVISPDELRRSCHDNIVETLRLISKMDPDPDGLGEDEYFDVARATGRRRAEQRIPLDAVLRSFRLGGRLLWEALIDQARAERHVDNGGLLTAATRVWEVMDVISTQVAAAYHATERELERADDQHRATVWEGLLHGSAKHMGFAHEAARVVGLPVAGRYAVVVADVRPGGERITGPLGRRLAVDEIDSAWRERADAVVGLLALGRAASGVALTGLREILNAPAGMSLVVDGLAEVGAAYRQAVLARSTVAFDHAEVAALEERLPEALLLGSPEPAEQLVRLWLGPLLELPAGERRLLLGTLETWVATGGSIRRTAELAHCHRNTVLNRLRRIHTITGREVSDPATHLELSLALRASRLMASDLLI